MGLILHHPRPVEAPGQAAPLIFDEPLPREAVAAYMRAHSVRQGDPFVASVVRRPFAGQITTVISPEKGPNGEDVTFDIKRCGVGENIERQNMSSKVRYIQSDDDGQIVSERDFPMGDLALRTVMLALAGWNLTDENERPIPVTTKNVTTYLSPKEFSFLYEAVLDVNPMWRGGGEEDTKDN